MSDFQQQADAIYDRPTVTVPLADYDRLRGIEERAQGCLRMTDPEKRHAGPGDDVAGPLDAYARQFVAYILEGR